MTATPIESPTSSRDIDAPADSGFVARPTYQLHSLPLSYRWEVTRRHPYYNIFWKNARDYYQYHREELNADDPDTFLSTCALIALQSIGVSGEPPDPVTEFTELDQSVLNSAWLSGAVHPISVRGLASMLIANCPPNTLKYLGAALFEASLDDVPDQLPRRQQKALDLMLADVSGLDVYFDGPFVAINPAASGRDVLKALDELMRQWKQRYGLPETRNRSEKYSEYLRVWDLREGWSMGVYDRAKEMTFKEIAKKLRKSISTIAKHYQNAFQLVVGHGYSAELWYRLFGPTKITALTSGIRGDVSDRRPLKSRTPRPIPKTRVTPPGKGASAVDFARSKKDFGNDARELFDAIQVAILRGDSDAQILEKLNLSKRALELTTYLRRRQEDA